VSQFKVGDRVIGIGTGTSVGTVVEIDDLVWPYVLELEDGTKGRYKEEELRLYADEERLWNEAMGAPSAPQQKWEYKVVNASLYERNLNELGQEGWELVSIVPPHPSGMYPDQIYKRPL
jgi:hypothetical protein